jgi:prephenate dehydrogenase
MRSAAKSSEGTARRARVSMSKKRPFRKVVIVGVGLIGGSIGMALRKRHRAELVFGVGPREDELKRAVVRKAIDRYETDRGNLEAAFKDADLIVLAASVGRLESIARSISSMVPKATMVTDVGSVKGGLVRRLEDPFSDPGSGRTRYVGAHPIAGREKSGIEAATSDLFANALCILTPTKRTAPKALEKVKRLWEGIGAQTVTMDPDTHDRIVAVVSHLPHVVAYALVNTVLELQSKTGDLVSYSGGGFKDFTRVAASSAEMWRDICLFNRDNLLSVIEAFEKVLDRFKRRLVAGDSEGLRREFDRAKEVKAETK